MEIDPNGSLQEMIESCKSEWSAEKRRMGRRKEGGRWVIRLKGVTIIMSWSWSLWSQPIRAVVWVVWCRTWLLPFLVSTRLWALPKSWSESFYWLIIHLQADSTPLGTSSPWSSPSSSLTRRPLVTPFDSFPSLQFWRRLWVSSALWAENLVPWFSRWARTMVILCQSL